MRLGMALEDEMERIWVLGAADPEMERIEALLREAGEQVAIATVEGTRVRPSAAYEAALPVEAASVARRGGEILLVECVGETDIPAVRIDHHREGDPGAGVAPMRFLAGASLGQVISRLGEMGLLPDWDEDPEAGEYAPHRPGALYDLPVWTVRCRGRSLRIPSDLVLAAAADHCLGAAYQGECPGVEPGELAAWRATSRAAFQGRPVGDVLQAVQTATEWLKRAPMATLAPESHTADCYCGAYTCGSPALRVRDMRGCRTCSGLGAVSGDSEHEGPCHYGPASEHLSELPEAAVRAGEAYIAAVFDYARNRWKIVLGGCTSPEIVEAFLTTWAPAQGLSGLYGDPARGFAGGYAAQGALLP